MSRFVFFHTLVKKNSGTGMFVLSMGNLLRFSSHFSELCNFSAWGQAYFPSYTFRPTPHKISCRSEGETTKRNEKVTWPMVYMYWKSQLCRLCICNYSNRPSLTSMNCSIPLKESFKINQNILTQWKKSQLILSKMFIFMKLLKNQHL